jgi:hypothetical protein
MTYLFPNVRYSTDMKEVAKAYKACKEALKIATKAKMVYLSNTGPQKLVLF